MQLNFQLTLLLGFLTVTTHAKDEQSPSLNIGDPAPPLRVCAWIKGTPVQQFEKGSVYVVEFWATWCKPCKAAMPHLSALAREYKDRVTILGIDILEKKSTSLKKVTDFVDSMGMQMDYHVAAEDSNFMSAGWLYASGEQGIPNSFVVDAEGRLAWIGHPKDLDKVLPKIVSNNWNIKKALEKLNLNKHLAKLDRETYYTLIPYLQDYFKKDFREKPDSVLLVIKEIVKKEPNLKYAPFIASYTFSALLKTNPKKAYEYGKTVIVTPTYDDPAYDAIIRAIDSYSEKLNLPVQIYQLGAEAYQLEIDHIPYPELYNMPKHYNNLAALYWRAKNKPKAIESQQKAIEALKSRKGFSNKDMVEFEARLKQYRNR